MTAPEALQDALDMSPATTPDPPTTAERTPVLLENMLEGMGDLVAVVDTSCRVIFANTAWRERFRAIYNVDAGPGTALDAIFAQHAGLRETCLVHWQRALAGETLTVREPFASDPGMGICETRFHPVRNHKRQVIGAALVGRDMTRIHAAENALRLLNETLEERVRERSAALKESEQQLRLAAESAGIGIWYWEPLNSQRQWSPLCVDLFGLSPGTEPDLETLLGKIVREDFERLRQMLFTTLETGEPFSAEFRVKADNGTVRWLMTRGQVDHHPNGQPRRVAGVVMDIDDLKKTQEDLLAVTEDRQAALAQLNSLLRNAPVGFVFFDRDYRYLRINEYLADKNGIPLKEHIGRPLADVLPDVAPVIMPVIDEVLRTGQPIHKQVVGATPREPDNPYSWEVIYYPVPNADGKPETVGGMVLEITERKRIEQALAESEIRFRTLFENAGVGLAQVALDGRWLRVNRRLAEMLGYTVEQLQNLTYRDVTFPEDLDKDSGLSDQLLRGTIHSYQLEKRYLRRDGEVIWCHLRVALQRDENGRPLYAISAIEDITIRRQTEEALRDADRRKDDFLAILAHELRNPLAAVSNAITLLRLPNARPEVRQQTLDIMGRQMQQLIRLVDDLMDVSRMTRGKVQLRKERFDLREAVQMAADSCRSSAEQARHTFGVDMPPTPVWIDGDRERLIQVFVNLLMNAVRYTDPGGTIHLRLTDAPDMIQVSCHDNGIGIPPQMLERIFDMFAQADDISQRGSTGLGLGLTLVKNLVEMHDGQVAASSPGLGQGSTFTVTLPHPGSVPLPITQKDKKMSFPATAHTKRRIMVVDDNEASAKTLGWMFEALGAEVQVVHSGQAALDAALENPPALILMDIGMPGMDGYEACRQMRGQAALKDILIVAQTGWGQPEDRRRAEAAGFSQHLVKPVMIEHLQTLLEDLDRRQAA